MSVCIRNAVPADAEHLLHFITELAIYEKAEHEVKATLDSIHSSLFSEGASAHALIVEVDGKVAGFAVYFFSYSTWLAQQGLYLEDLYVSPEYRGRAAGLALLKHLARIAVDTQCGRFEWSVLDWNEPAIAFYKKCGAQPQDEWIRYRMSGDTLKQFAA